MNREQLLLNKLAASAAEITKRSLKCQQFGYDDGWNDSTNREDLNHELNDLNALVQMLNAETELGFKPDKYACMGKTVKVNRWADYSKEKGFLISN